MRKAFIAFQILLLLLLGYLSWYLVSEYQTPHGRREMPFIIWAIDMVNLFLHEGGHGIFGLFGRFMHFLGGSLIQVLLPVAALIVFLRTSGPRSLTGTLYWLGHNLANIAVYIDDAPKQQLTLISRHAIHDWRWLCTSLGILDWAEDMAAAVLMVGGIALLGGLAAGAYFVVRDIREEFLPCGPMRL